MMPFIAYITLNAIISFVIYSGATFRIHTGHGMSLGEVGAGRRQRGDFTFKISARVCFSSNLTLREKAFYSLNHTLSSTRKGLAYMRRCSNNEQLMVIKFVIS